MKCQLPTDHGVPHLGRGSERRNRARRPIAELGVLTPQQLFSAIAMERKEGVLLLGKPAHSACLLTALHRRSSLPYALIVPSDSSFPRGLPEPVWMLSRVEETPLPAGNGIIRLTYPASSYADLLVCADRMRDHFLILLLKGGLQIGPEMLTKMAGCGYALVTDNVPGAISKDFSAGGLFKRIDSVIMYESSGASHELVEVLPTYLAEKAATSFGINFNNHSGFFRGRQSGISYNQSKEAVYKPVFEKSELNRLSAEGKILVYRPHTDAVYVARLAASIDRR